MGGIQERVRNRKKEIQRERRESTVLRLVVGSNSAHFTAKLFYEKPNPHSKLNQNQIQKSAKNVRFNAQWIQSKIKYIILSN